MSRVFHILILFIFCFAFLATENLHAQSGPNIRLQYDNRDTTPSGRQALQPTIRLYNDDDVTLNLSDITIRYWFTSEPPGQDIFVVDYAAVGNGSLTGTFHTVNGERYLEVGLTSAATIPGWMGGGTANQFPAGIHTGDMQFKIRDDGWADTYNQADDYSFDAGITTYTDYDKITVYYQGSLVWGIPPDGTMEAEGMNITRQPVNTTAGEVISPAPTVFLEDAIGNPVSGVDVTVSLNRNNFTVGSTIFVTTDENGEAVFDNLVIENADTGYEIHFDADASMVTDLDSDLFDVTAAAAEELSVTQHPSTATAGSSLSPTPSVTLTDEFGNPVEGVDVVVSLNKNSFASGSTTVETNSFGVATFSDLVITAAADNYQLTFDPDVAGIENAISSNFNIDPAPADIMAFTQQPQESVTDGVIAGPPTVIIVDEYNNPVSGINVTVSETGGYIFDSGTLTKQTNSSGVAVFNNMEIHTPDTGYQLEFDADAAGVANITSNTFEVVSSGGSLAITRQPTQTVAGIAISPAPAIRLLDGSNNPITGVAVTVTLNQGGFASGTLTVPTNGSGIAAFNDLVIETADTGYELTFSADQSGVSNVFSDEFTVIAASPDAMSLTTQPGNTAAGNNLSGPPSVLLEDAYGNPVSGVDITVTLNKNSFASGTTTVATNSSGIASFSTLKINTASTAYRLTFNADASGVSNVDSDNFNITAATAASLSITVQPNDATAEVTISPAPTVRVRDAFGNNKPGVNVTATINQGSFAAGSTTVVTSNSSGLAAFGNLKINTINTDYEITFSTPGSGPVTTQAFDVLQPNPPFGSIRLQYDNDNTTPTGVQSIRPHMRLFNDSDLDINLSDITVRYWFSSEPNGQDVFEVDNLEMGPKSDVFGSFGQVGGRHYLEVGFSPEAVLEIGLGGDGVTPNLMPIGGTTGLMQLRIHDDGWNNYNQTDDYSWDDSITTLTDYPFINVYYKGGLVWGTPPTGTTEATAMTITQQPTSSTAGELLSPAPVVSLKDALGNPVSGIEVTAIVNQNSFVAGSTTIVTTDENGEAVFNNLGINHADSGYQISFDPDAAMVNAQNSTTFDVSPAAGTELSIIQQPTTQAAGSNISPFPSVMFSDEFGNPVPGVTVTISLNKNSFASGNQTVATNSSGIATFNDLVITLKDTGYQLIFDPDAPGIPDAVSSTFNISSAAASTVTITKQPGESVVGGVIAGPPAVRISDAYNNPVEGSDVTVSETGGYTLDAGTLTRSTNSSGIATFNDLKINTVGTGYRLTFDPVAAGVANATSNTFDVISSGGAMAVIQQPTQTVAGVIISPSPTVEVLDDLNNPLPGTEVTLSLNQGGFASGTLTVVTNGSGLAVFDDLVIEAAGTGYEIMFDAGQSGIADVFSQEFDIVADNPDVLTVSTQPSNTAAGFNIQGAPAVTLSDVFGNPVPGVDVTVTLNKNSFDSGTTTITTNSGGIASFTDLKIHTATTAYQLMFDADAVGVSSVSSNNFDITAADAETISITVQPEITTAGILLSPVPTVLVTDTYGNPKPDVNVTASLNQNTFVGGSTVIVSSNSSGLSSFSNLKINTVSTGYEMTFSVPGLTPVTSNSFDVIQPDPAFGTIRLQYMNNEPNTSAQSILPYIKLFNESGLTLKLSDITIRYWFTSEPDGEDEYEVDHLEMGEDSDVTGTFDEVEGNHYFEIGFSPDAILEIGLGGDGFTPDFMPDNATTGDMQFRVHDELYENYDQSDDYSFDAGVTTYTDYEYINVYYKGQLVWGISPSIAEIFYSRQTGDWDNPASWSKVSHAGTTSTEAPDEEDTVVIADNDIITLTDDVTNHASITVNDTGTLATGNHTLSGSGDFNLEAGGSLRIGSAEGISQNGPTGNIQNEGSRSFSVLGNYVYNGSTPQVTGNGLPATIDGDLTIDNSSGVAATQSIRVDGVLFLEEGTFIFDDSLSLIANDKQIASGDLTFKLQITGQAGYRMLSTPVSADFSNFLSEVLTQGFTGADLGTSFQPNILWYDETAEGTDNARWRAPSNISDNAVTGRGYHVYMFGNIPEDNNYNDPLPYTLEVKGQENEGTGGNVDLNVSYSPDGDEGWNLVGNPFGAAVDWGHASWTKTNIGSSIYIWDPNTNQYNTWNGSTQIGDITDGIIAPFQGFWIKASGAEPELLVNRAAKTFGGNFLGREIRHFTQYPRISIEARHSEHLASSVHFSFTEDGSNEVNDFDAYRLLPPPGIASYLEIYSQGSNGEHLAINNLPRRFGSIIEIPVDMNAYMERVPVTQDIELTVTEFENIPSSWKVYLVNMNTDERMNITGQNSIRFSMSHVRGNKLTASADQAQKTTIKGGDSHTSFKLVIEPGDDAPPGLSTEFELYQNHPNPFTNSTTFRFDVPRESRVRLDIFDTAGRNITTVFDKSFQPGTRLERWDAGNLASGTYFARLVTPDGVHFRPFTVFR